MARNSEDLDSMMRSLVDDRIDEISSGSDKGSDPGPIDDEEQIEGLFSRCSSQEGYYGKVYRKFPVPAEFGSRPVFLVDLPQPEAIDDIESELLRLGQANLWPDGLYEVKLFKRGESGVRKARRMALQFPKPGSASATGASTPTINPFETLTQTAKVIKELQGASAPNNQAPSASPEAILAAVTEAYKAGIEVSKGNGNGENKIFEIIKAVKELAPPPEPPKSPNLLELVQALGALSKHNNPPVSQNQDDFFDKLIKLKAAGFLGSDTPKEDSTAKALEMLGSIIPLVQTLGGGGGGDNTSTAIELIRQLAPQAGKIIENVTGTINNAIGLKAKAMSSVSQGGPMEYIPYPEPSRAVVPVQPSYMDPYKPSDVNSDFSVPLTITPGETIPVQPVSPTISPEEEAMFGFFKKFRLAIESNDSSFYPELRGVLQGIVPPDVFTQIVEGTVPVAMISDKIRPYGGEFFSLPPAQKYMQDFIGWMQSNEVTGKCKQCGDEYIYDSLEQIKSDNKCNSCGGEVVAKA